MRVFCNDSITMSGNTCNAHQLEYPIINYQLRSAFFYLVKYALILLLAMSIVLLGMSVKIDTSGIITPARLDEISFVIILVSFMVILFIAGIVGVIIEHFGTISGVFLFTGAMAIWEIATANVEYTMESFHHNTVPFLLMSCFSVTSLSALIFAAMIKCGYAVLEPAPSPFEITFGEDNRGHEFESSDVNFKL